MRLLKMAIALPLAMSANAQIPIEYLPPEGFIQAVIQMNNVPAAPVALGSNGLFGFCVPGQNGAQPYMVIPRGGQFNVIEPQWRNGQLVKCLTPVEAFTHLRRKGYTLAATIHVMRNYPTAQQLRSIGLVVPDDENGVAKMK